MITPGFMLRRLEFRGRSREPAILDFSPGLNVISGASDTGKSYVVQCLDFMFGAETAPEAIPESQGYDQILLTIETWAGRQFTLERAMKGGDFALHDSTTDVQRTLREKHGPKDDNVSTFLLTLCDLANKKIRKNQDGKTIAASFRYLSKLVLVPEERIFTKASPFLSGQYTKATAEESLLLMLLSGEDDSGVIHHDARGITTRRAEIDAQKALLEDLLADARRKLEAIRPGADAARVNEDLARANELIGASALRVAQNRDLIRAEQQTRQETWNALQQARSQLIVQRELGSRFSLLRAHYETDLERLKAVAEAAHYVDQLSGDRCPLCGADPEHQHAGDVPLVELASSIEAERNKISVLLADLSQTTTKLEATIGGLESEAAAFAQQLAQSERRLEEELTPAAELVTQDLSTLLARRSELERMQSVAAETTQFTARIAKLSAAVVPTAPADPKRPRVVGLTSHIDGVAQEIEKLLKVWGFPIKGRVVFSSEDHDFMIGSRKRASTGKGLRAVSYAAFSVALLRYCRGQDLPHPGFLVLDSPLVAYREKETPPGEEVPPDLKSNFYRDLASDGTKAQYVILENEHPPEDLASSIRWTRFTGAEGHGRYGLFLPNTQPRRGRQRKSER